MSGLRVGTNTFVVEERRLYRYVAQVCKYEVVHAVAVITNLLSFAFLPSEGGRRTVYDTDYF